RNIDGADSIGVLVPGWANLEGIPCHPEACHPEASHLEACHLEACHLEPSSSQPPRSSWAWRHSPLTLWRFVEAPAASVTSVITATAAVMAITEATRIGADTGAPVWA